MMLIQVLVADILGIVRRHVPGTPVNANHADALFRAARTVANTNESIAIFIGALLFCVLVGASSEWTGWWAWGFALCRAAYALCYYANWPTLRSITFALSLICLAALIVLGLLA